jgi:hypothetical protein
MINQYEIVMRHYGWKDKPLSFEQVQIMRGAIRYPWSTLSGTKRRTAPKSRGSSLVLGKVGHVSERGYRAGRAQIIMSLDRSLGTDPKPIRCHASL